jgi:spore maturation protein CgeB
MGKAVNQRVFDVPACGGFLLTDEQESLEELFEIGREVVTFRHPEEIPELARFYLGHPADRDAVARRGRQRVLAEHTYRHRLSDLVQRMKATYGCRCERLCKG